MMGQLPLAAVLSLQGAGDFVRMTKRGAAGRDIDSQSSGLRISKCGIENGTELITLERGTG